MPIPNILLKGTKRDFMIDALLRTTPIDKTAPAERCLLGLVIPPWQRAEVWSQKQKIAFIESIFLGFGTGYYVVNGADFDKEALPMPMSGWLLDGQQRLTAIRDFVEDKFAVFDDVIYGKMDKIVARRRFLHQPFPCFELEFTQDEQALKELYRRLNFGGLPHTEADLKILETERRIMAKPPYA